MMLLLPWPFGMIPDTRAKRFTQLSCHYRGKRRLSTDGNQLKLKQLQFNEKESAGDTGLGDPQESKKIRGVKFLYASGRESPKARGLFFVVSGALLAVEGHFMFQDWTVVEGNRGLAMPVPD